MSKASSLDNVFWDQAWEGIIQVSLDGSIQRANPRALKILGYTAESIAQLNLFDLLEPGDGTEKVRLELREAIAAGSEFTANRINLKGSRSHAIVTEMCCHPLDQAEAGRDVSACAVILFQDITARTLNEQRLIKLAKYDVVTGLANRSKFHDFTEGKIAYCEYNHKELALIYIDIDHFKNINEALGHDAGDDLLTELAERMSKCIREGDLVARIGGDEFAITLVEMGSPNQVTRIVKKLLNIISEPIVLQNREFCVSASVGISLYPESGNDLTALCKAADTALYQAKRDGRNTYRFFSEEIQNRVMEQSSLEDALRKAINNEEFSLHYQPQVDAGSGRIVGLEALIRWQHPDWPNIGPHQFIPIAEESGLLPAIGLWVLKEACSQAMAWRNQQGIQFDFPVAVNLSPKQLLKQDFIESLQEVLDSTGMPPSNLVLELTETAVMHDPDVAIGILNEIQQAGVQISVDDFGTGYSSLNYLRRLPISKLKIDRSFVKDIGIDQNGEAIVKAILALAHSLNLQVIAEGVEEESHVEFLRGIQCDQLQGYFFSRPLPVDQLEEILRNEWVKWSSQEAGIINSDTANKFRPSPLH